MKSQMSKPRHTREKYTQEYKAQALKLWRESGRSANLVAAQLGIRSSFPICLRAALGVERGRS